MAAIGGLSLLSFVFIVTQVSTGFGMQRAIRQQVAKQFQEERKAAKESRATLEGIDFKQEQELAKFKLQRTVWLYLALAVQALAILATLAYARLEHRDPSKPAPRLVFEY